jgi:hypothetical protein
MFIEKMSISNRNKDCNCQRLRHDKKRATFFIFVARDFSGRNFTGLLEAHTPRLAQCGSAVGEFHLLQVSGANNECKLLAHYFRHQNRNPIRGQK